MSGFCDTFGLKSLIKGATCYKNPENPSSTDLILINNPHGFQNSCIIETVLSDFHRIVVTVMKTSFERLKTRVINYRGRNFAKSNTPPWVFFMFFILYRWYEIAQNITHDET